MPDNYEKLRESFKRLIKDGKLSHAYLFFGGDDRNHQDKFIFAQSLANFLENEIFEEPIKLLRETLILKETIGIDEIRFLKYFLWQKPTNSVRRVVIIKEAEVLTPEAQSAALKIVEEPPELALIIFIANSEDSLLPTLNSRLQKIYFSRLAYSETTRIDADEYADLRGSTTCDDQKLTAPVAKSLSISDVQKLENEQIEEFFESLIKDFGKDLIKNSKQLKAVLNHLVLMKQFNLNKRLQLRALISSIE